jgi:hypothetical protein
MTQQFWEIATECDPPPFEISLLLPMHFSGSLDRRAALLLELAKIFNPDETWHTSSSRQLSIGIGSSINVEMLIINEIAWEIW